MSPFQIALNLGQRAHTARGRTLRGRWVLVPSLPKRGLVVPKVFTPKNCISGSQGKWTLGCSMEAIKTCKSLYQHWFESEAQENRF